MTRGTVLCFEEREEVSRGVVAEESGREIASRLGRHYSVVNREIARNGGRSAYRASEAQWNAAVSAMRPKDRKVEKDPLLLAEVNKGLTLKWSPQQISTRLRMDQDYLDAVAFELNGRPRQTLGWLKPSEKLNCDTIGSG